MVVVDKGFVTARQIDVGSDDLRIKRTTYNDGGTHRSLSVDFGYRETYGRSSREVYLHCALGRHHCTIVVCFLCAIIISPVGNSASDVFRRTGNCLHGSKLLPAGVVMQLLAA